MKKQKDESFIELILVSIGKRAKLVSCLSDEEWAELHYYSIQHNILGLAFAGIQKLPKEQMPPSDLLANGLVRRRL